MPQEGTPLHVSLVTVPEAMVSTLGGLYDVLNSFPVISGLIRTLPRGPFRAELVTPSAGPVMTASGWPIQGRSIAELAQTDIVIVPSLMPENGEWEPGRYPEMVAWLERMHASGALLCSACTGVLLLAETGLLDGRKVTIHPQLLDTFARNFPSVELTPDHVLVTAGDNDEFVTSGSTTTWQDLVLYLIARHVDSTSATEIARFFALQGHDEGQTLYTVFVAPTKHGDALVRWAQDWLETHFTDPHPVDGMVAQCAASERTFKRRFGTATGHSPLAYVQRLRVEAAKRRLERSDDPVDEIAWAVGYEDAAFFRRLFKRLIGVSPALYRRRLRMPDLTQLASVPDK